MVNINYYCRLSGSKVFVLQDITIEIISTNKGNESIFDDLLILFVRCSLFEFGKLRLCHNY